MDVSKVGSIMEEGEREGVCVWVHGTTRTNRNEQTKAKKMQNNLVSTLLRIAWI